METSSSESNLVRRPFFDEEFTVNAIAEPSGLSLENYFAQEGQSAIKHEYIGGIVYAMPGASKRHNAITLEIASLFSRHFGDGPSQVYSTDVKVSFIADDKQIIYYPDVAVTCDSREDDEYLVRFPKLVVEVSSESTEGVDRREKFWTYIQIETLEEYVLVSQDRVELTVFRRGAAWKPEVFKGAEDEVRLASIGLTLQVKEIYRRVNFGP